MSSRRWMYVLVTVALVAWAGFALRRPAAAPVVTARTATAQVILPVAAPGKRPSTAPVTAPVDVPVALATLAPANRPATPPTTRPGTRPVMWPADDRDLGPDVVILDVLSKLYEPVPFDHKSHALMANMSTGCVTCHHHQPDPTQQPARPDAWASAGERIMHTQADTVTISDCKSCHAIHLSDADIGMPGLKGAYHRQCLNCHKEWTHANACSACHQPLGEHPDERMLAMAATPDDVLGRMHPPLPEPDTVLYKMRYTPVDGGNVLFRHKEHTQTYGLRCTSCHAQDSCANCHDSGTNGDRPHSRPVRPAMTWAESHGPCLNCHVEDRCQQCHFQDGAEPPPPFSHARVSQRLDTDHADLQCRDCHTTVKSLEAPPTCGDSSCHADPGIAFPAYRPGPWVEPSMEAATQPATRKASRRRPGQGMQ